MQLLANIFKNKRFCLSNYKYRSIIYYKRFTSSTANENKNNLPKDVKSSFPDAYNSTSVEAGWYDWWHSQGFFAPAKTNPESKVFSLILPPPNVTGQLHLGHALTATIQDALVRWHRMRGFETIWVPGSDHAGIATQVVVEKWIQSELGMNRHQLGREKFLEQVWKWKEDKGDLIFMQLQKLGTSLDWNRKTFTMDKQHSASVNHAFVQLFNSGLIYRGNFLVNWSTRLESAISDIEVEHIEVTKKTKFNVPGVAKPIDVGLIYNIAYKLFDNTLQDSGSNCDEIVVSTTRPETLLGDVAVAVHPQDQRYAKLIGKKLIHPFRQSESGPSLIPIIPDEAVNPEFGTGAVKVTPGHDQTDFAIGQRHLLPIIDVISKEGKIQFQLLDLGQNEHKLNQGSERLNSIGEKFEGLSRFDCRWSILSELKSVNLYRGQRDHPMNIPVCSRSGDIVEKLLKPQWFIKVDKLAKKALQAAERKEIQFDPKINEKLWGQWLSADRDWCISRQLWWGHRIPVWQLIPASGINSSPVWIAALDEAGANEQAAKLCNSKDYSLLQDEDVLDTWFSSALLPFANFGWPNKGPDFDRYFPLSLMETGHDILFFWVARMVMLSIQLTGKLPFENVLLHGIICDSHGRKMSKSLGNVIDPLNIINGKSLKAMESDIQENSSIVPSEKKKALDGLKKDFPDGIPEYGSDALRFGLCSYDVKSHQINLDLKLIKSSSAFCNKLWQACRFYVQAVDRIKDCPEILNKFQQFHSMSENEQINFFAQNFGKLNFVDKWMLSQCAESVANINTGLAEADFHVVTKNLRSFIYSSLCDVYLESIKPRLSDTDRPDFQSCFFILHLCIQTGLKLLHPIMPFITEELHQRLAQKNDLKVESIMCLNYPTTDQWSSLVNPTVRSEMEFVLEIVTEIRSLKQLYDLKRHHKPQALIFQSVDAISTSLPDVCQVIQTLTCTENVRMSKAAGSLDTSNLQKEGWASAKVPHRDCVVLINVASHININLEKNRVMAKKMKLLKDLQKVEASISNCKTPDEKKTKLIAKMNLCQNEVDYLQEQIKFLESIQVEEIDKVTNLNN